MKKRVIALACMVIILVFIGLSSCLAAPSSCPACGASMNVSYSAEYMVYAGDRVIGNMYFLVYDWRKSYTARCTAHPSQHVYGGYDFLRSEYVFIGYI